MNKKYDIMILSGGFDPVHEGHVAMFEHAAKLAHEVIVGLNSDAWLTRKKGKPFMKFESRLIVVSSMRAVDLATKFNDDDGTACDLISSIYKEYCDEYNHLKLRIAFGNGGDRSGKDKIPTAEAIMCEKLGIEMVWGVGGEEKANSSSWLIKNATDNCKNEEERKAVHKTISDALVNRNQNNEEFHRTVGVIVSDNQE